MEGEETSIVFEGHAICWLMKVQNQLIILTFISAVLLSASVNSPGQKVRYNFLEGTDFSKYKTYRWVKMEQLEYPTADVDQMIRRSIDAILSSRGLARVEEGDSDLLAIYQAALTQEKNWISYKTGSENWEYGGWYGWGGGRPRVSMSMINTGTLNLDFYDVALKKHVWRGEASKTLKPPKDPVKLQARIDKAMAKLLSNFPPRATD